MVRAVGYSNNEFNPSKPGRLCRGRERWIEPWSDDEDNAPIYRLVISGAAFEDDSARDALRGVVHAGLDLVTVMTTLYPRAEFLAFTEDAHPADIPEDAEQVELYETYRAGGREQVTGVRWVKRVTGVANLRALLSGPGGVESIRGFAVLKKGTNIDEFLDPLFLLVGMSTLDSPPARFQPLAMPELLAHVDALILIHRDKHGHALGIYSREPIQVEKKLATLTSKKGAMLIPFAIPPMLARWDRALAEVRSTWDVETQGEFPVPESDRPYSWDRRRRTRRRRSDDDGDESEGAMDGDAIELDELDDSDAEQPVRALEAVETDDEDEPSVLDDFDDFLIED